MDQRATRGAKPHSYREGYQPQVLDLVVSTGRMATVVASEIGVHPTLLCRWVGHYGASHATVVPVCSLAAAVLKPLPVPSPDPSTQAGGISS